MKKTMRKQIEEVKYYFENKDMKKSAILLAIFILINTIKITIYNIFITENQSVRFIGYKFLFNLVFAVIIWLMLLGLRRKGFAIAFYVLQAVYCGVNLIYYIFFSRYLHIVQAFSLIGEALGVTQNLQLPLDIKMLVLLIDLPLFIYLIIKYERIYTTRKALHIVSKFLMSAAIIIFIIIELKNAFSKNSLIHIIKTPQVGESIVVERYGTIVNNLSDLFVRNDEATLIKSLNYGKEQKSNIEKMEKPNIIMIQVESMDSNIINEKYKGKFITPYLNSLSKNNIYYPYALSYHMGGGTSDCDFSINNSIEPLPYSPVIKLVNYKYDNAFPKMLIKGGYYTATFHGNVSSYFGRDTAFKKMGYIDFFDKRKANLSTTGWGASDKDVFEYALKKIKSFKEPHLSYIITMTSHSPFTNVNNCTDNAEYNDIPEKIVAQYFKSLNYVDGCIKNFIENYRAFDRDSYIIIFGDHTPSVKEDEYWQSSLYENNTYYEFVPIIIITPDNKKYTEAKAVASFLDIAPTVLNAAGVKFNIRSDGTNLLNLSAAADPIPYLGKLYEREKLFDKISNANYK